MKVAGRRVIVTGGASGIGEASVRRFATEGAKVAFVDVQASEAERVRADLARVGIEVSFHVADVRDEVAARETIDAVAEELGGVDVLHYNAGAVAGSTAAATSLEDWDRVHAVNLRAPWLWSKHAIRHLRQDGGGSIVFTGSTSGLVGYPGTIAYTSSKGGLVNLTRSLALELASDGITVNAVCPGHIDTPMTRAAFEVPGDARATESNLARHAQTVPIGRLGQPEEVAAFVVFLASDDARFCTGGIYPCDGGITAQ